MNKDSKIYVAGHKGLAGSAILRCLISKGYTNIVTATHGDLELRCPHRVTAFFDIYKPEYVFLAAAHAGGIKEAIDNPAEMITDNLLIQANVIGACHEFGVKKLIFLGSSCVYPIDAPQPYKEESLNTGKTDENWSYAIAKLAGMEMCRAYHKQYGCDFLTVMPCNLYGPNDNFDLYKAHVIPALIRKFHEGGKVEVWGTGKARREFLYSDDFASACVFIMESCDYHETCDGVINIGCGKDIEIKDVVDLIRNIVNPDATFTYTGDYDGVGTKVLDTRRLTLMGWKPQTPLFKGIGKVYEQYAKNKR